MPDVRDRRRVAHAIDVPDRRVAEADRRDAANAHRRRAAKLGAGKHVTPGAFAIIRSRKIVGRHLLDASCRRRRASRRRCPSSTLRCWPVAVVTTSSSCATATARTKSTVAVCRPYGDRPSSRLVADAQHLELHGADRRVLERELTGIVRRRRQRRTDGEHSRVGERPTALLRHATGNRALRGSGRTAGAQPRAQRGRDERPASHSSMRPSNCR